MTDAQFQQLLDHIYRLGNDVFFGMMYIAIILMIAGFLTSVTK